MLLLNFHECLISYFSIPRMALGNWMSGVILQQGFMDKLTSNQIITNISRESQQMAI